MVSTEQEMAAVKQFAFASYILTPPLVVIALYTGFVGANIEPIPIVLLGVLQLFFASLHWVLLKKFRNPIAVHDYTWTHTIVTLLVMTAAIHYTGGIVSPFSWLYLLSILLEIMLLTPQKGVKVAFLSIVLYSALILTEFFGIIRNPSATVNGFFPYSDAVFVFSHLFGNIVLITIATFLMGVLKIQVQDRETELQSLVENVQQEEAQTRKLLEQALKKK